ncbi:MAG: hypothetical protein EOO12_00260 [Chitinophagaceae bacterium]|nr:MAG: hypothetical protein EOO12_00260 [Chitinophagaceae bacterium]
MPLQSVLRSPLRPVVSTAAGEGMGLLLLDDFERADTADGTLGTAPTGQAWALKGAADGGYPPLPVSSFGKITSGGFVVPGGQTTYAFALLARKPRTIFADWSWLDDTVGTDFTTLAILVTNDPVNNWIETMLHITVTNGVCRIQKRISGAWTDLNTGAQTISPSLALASTVHRLRLDIVGSTVRVRIDGTAYDQSVTDSDIATITGPRVGFEHYSASTDVRWPMTIRSVGATG